jgi:hypothetical protein
VKTKTTTLTPELLHQMDAYWRAANYLSVGQIYLHDNPLLKPPLTLADMKPAWFPSSSRKCSWTAITLWSSATRRRRKSCEPFSTN